jgi:Lon protease-like protein
VAELIPLFPLSHVLLPGMPLPLHIFEERYRELLADLTSAPGQARFGVVALRSGTEVLSPHAQPSIAPDVESIGTLAEILEVRTEEDGTSDLLSVGSKRFAIESVLIEGRPYLRAQVRFLDEVDGDLDLRQVGHARALMELYDETLHSVAGRATGAELPTDANQLSYQIAARLPLPPDERQALLAEPTTQLRLARLIRLLRREIALLKCTRSIAVSPAVLRIVASGN